MASAQPVRILLADDQPDVLAALRLLLKSEGYETKSVSSPAAVLDSVRSEPFDLLLMDLNYTRDTTSGREGLELLAQLRSLDRSPGVVVMTAWGSVELAVQAMQQGARDFIMKPWDNARLIETIRRHTKAAVTTARDRLPLSEMDLTIARRVQRKLLPKETIRLRTAELAAFCVQAGAVGGDYYDYFPLGEGRTLFALADVSGKGIPAAMLMANLQATLRSRCQGRYDGIGALARSVNRFFFESTEPEHFATAFLAEYDDRDRTVRYVNCGHNPPLLLRSSGASEALEPTGTVIGAFPTCRFESAETRLDAGDLLVICSDGVLEARGADDEQFGTERLTDALARHIEFPIGELPRRVARTVAAFSAFGQEDDVTLLIARGV